MYMNDVLGLLLRCWHMVGGDCLLQYSKIWPPLGSSRLCIWNHRGLTPQAWAFVARCSDEKTDGNVNTLSTFATIGVHVYQISFSIWWILFMIWEGIISSPWWEREQSAWVWVTFGGRSMLNPDGSPLNSEDFYSLARVLRIAGQSTTNQWKMATAMFLWRKNSYFQMEQR